MAVREIYSLGVHEMLFLGTKYYWFNSTDANIFLFIRRYGVTGSILIANDILLIVAVLLIKKEIISP